MVAIVNKNILQDYIKQIIEYYKKQQYMIIYFNDNKQYIDDEKIQYIDKDILLDKNILDKIENRFDFFINNEELTMAIGKININMYINKLSI